MPHDVFISYSSHDKAIADAICAALEAPHVKIRCWIAPRDVLGGTEYANEIVNAINECRAMVLVFSTSANNSPDIGSEVHLAFSKEKTIVPFRIENVPPIGAMEYHLSKTHWLDALTPPLETRIAELVACITRLLDGRAALAPPRINTDSRTRPVLKPRLSLIAGLTALITIGFATWYQVGRHAGYPSTATSDSQKRVNNAVAQQPREQSVASPSAASAPREPAEIQSPPVDANTEFVDRQSSMPAKADQTSNRLSASSTSPATPAPFTLWKSLPAPKGKVSALALSPDAKSVAVVAPGQEGVRVWHIEDEVAKLALEVKYAVESVTWSSDGKNIAAGSHDGIVRMWEASSGKLIRQLPERHPDSAYLPGLAFAPDSRVLASASYKNLIVWDTTAWKPICSLELEQRGFIAFSADGMTLATCSGSEAYFWDTEKWTRTRTLAGHKQGIGSLAFSPDGQQFVTGGLDSTAVLWNARTGEFLHRLADLQNWVGAAAFSPDSKILALGCEYPLPIRSKCEIRLYDPKTKMMLQTIADIGTSVEAIAFSKDGRLLIAGGENQGNRYAATEGWITLWRRQPKE